MFKEHLMINRVTVNSLFIKKIGPACHTLPLFLSRMTAWLFLSLLSLAHGAHGGAGTGCGRGRSVRTVVWRRRRWRHAHEGWPVVAARTRTLGGGGDEAGLWRRGRRRPEAGPPRLPLRSPSLPPPQWQISAAAVAGKAGRGASPPPPPSRRFSLVRPPPQAWGLDLPSSRALLSSSSPRRTAPSHWVPRRHRHL